MRVLLAPTNTANQAALQAAALRARGHDAECWHFGRNPFGYTPDRPRAWGTTPADELELVREVANGGYDVIHLHQAGSLAPPLSRFGELWDLALWRRAGIRVVMSLHGTDMRDAEREKAIDPWSYYHFGAVAGDPEHVAARLDAIRLDAHCITVSAGSNLLHVPDAQFLPLAIDVDAQPLGPPPTRDVPVIAHAPSARATKGTEMVLAALGRLRDAGVPHEVDLIEGVGNTEALRRLAQADIVVEKVLGDGYGMTTLEAFRAGRPVVTRVTERGLRGVQNFPGSCADPDTIESALRELIESPERRARMGREGRAFVEREHSLAAVSVVLDAIYEGTGARRPDRPPRKRTMDRWASVVRHRLDEHGVPAATAEELRARRAVVREVVALERRRALRRWAARQRAAWERTPRVTASSPQS